MKRKNDNCLAGMRCPQCKSLEPFEICVLCTVQVRDEGTEETHDMEWDDTNACSCPACGFHGTVRDFKVASQKKRGAEKLVACPKAGKCAAARHNLCDHAEPHTKHHLCGRFGCPECLPLAARKQEGRKP